MVMFINLDPYLTSPQAREYPYMILWIEVYMHYICTLWCSHADVLLLRVLMKVCITTSKYKRLNILLKMGLISDKR